MEKRNQWLIQIGEEDKYWPCEYRDSLPSAICFEYDYLRTLASEGNTYGVLLQIRDIFETLMKIPCVMGIIILENTHEETSPAYGEVMRLVLGKPMTMGDWYTLAGILIRKKNGFSLPKTLNVILKKTQRLYECEIEPDGADIVYWRNETIGHGALRFEEDPSYEAEVTSILKALRMYFSESLKDLYKDLYIQCADRKITGDEVLLEKGQEAQLCAEGTIYPVDEYIISHELTCFFFDAYYLRKKKARYSSFMGGKEFLESRKYFIDLCGKLERMELEGHQFNQETTTRGEEALLEYLAEPSGYIRPQALIDELNDQMEELEKGIITIQMERGTGKSAFANQMSGLHHGKTLIRNSFSRIYHLSNAALRGLEDFEQALNFSFSHSFDSANDLYSTAIYIPVLDIHCAQPEIQMADFLNAWHRLYQKEKTILILDGIDELTDQTRQILDCIPASDLLEEGVFLVLLCRFEEESSVSGNSVRMIHKAVGLSDSVIQIRRTDKVNTETMRRYIEKETGTDYEADELIQKADHRFLYLRPYILIRDHALLDQSDEKKFIESYMHYLFSLYDKAHQRRLKEIIANIALFPSITMNEYTDYLNCPQLTYSFIGLFNDLMPLLSVVHHPDGSQYELADTAYREYVLETYTDIVKEAADYFDQSLRDHLDSYFKSVDYDSEVVFYHSIWEKKFTEAEKSIYFFGKNLLSLWQLSDEKPYFSPETLWLLVSGMILDRRTDYGYPLVVRQSLLRRILELLKDGITSEAEGKSFHHFFYDFLLTKPASELNRLKNALSDLPEFAQLYSFVLDHLKEIADHERFFWILDEDSVSEDVYRKISEFSDLDAFVNYQLKADRLMRDFDHLPNTEVLKEETIQTLKDQYFLYDGLPPQQVIFNADPAVLKQNIDQVMCLLNNPDIDFSVTDPSYYVIGELYIYLHQYEQVPEIADSLLHLHQAFYERLCKEDHPAYLYQLLDDLYPERQFALILRRLYGEEGTAMLVNWADRFFETSIFTDEQACRIPVDLLLTAMEEYGEKADFLGLTTAAEKLVYDYDPYEFFGRAEWNQFKEDLENRPDILLLPLAYCTDNALALLELYHSLGMKEKADNLYKRMYISVAVIEDYANAHNWKEEVRNNQIFALIRMQKHLHLEGIGEPYAKKLEMKMMNHIISFLESADIHSNYLELEMMIRKLFEYDRKLADPQSASRHHDELISLVRSYEEHADNSTKQILENEVLFVQELLKEWTAEQEI